MSNLMSCGYGDGEPMFYSTTQKKTEITLASLKASTAWILGGKILPEVQSEDVYCCEGYVAFNLLNTCSGVGNTMYKNSNNYNIQQVKLAACPFLYYSLAAAWSHLNLQIVYFS